MPGLLGSSATLRTGEPHTIKPSWRLNCPFFVSFAASSQAPSLPENAVGPSHSFSA
jgi:hypothetical protein